MTPADLRIDRAVDPVAGGANGAHSYSAQLLIDTAKETEALGFHGIWTGETAHDPFLPIALFAAHTDQLTVGTSVAIALARSPMHLANLGYDLQALSSGRFVLGLGPQIRPHVEKRFSAQWDPPIGRLREIVGAVRAIWRSWWDGEPLAFRGTYYTHTLMGPAFDPGRRPYGPPPIFLGAVGPSMTRLAGEIADGLIAHSFTTPRYLRQTTLPNLLEGLARHRRHRADVHVVVPVFMVLDGPSRDHARAAVRRQLAFYGSTPAYRPVLEAHGWGDLQPELNALSKQGRWDEMANLVDDQVLDAFCVQGTAEEVRRQVTDRYGQLVDRVTVYVPYTQSAGDLAPLLSGRAGARRW